MNYSIQIAKSAENDLREALDYVEYVLKSPQAADELLEDFYECVLKLQSYPERHALVDDTVLKAWGVRFIPVKKYLVFYMVNSKEQVVYVVRFLYGKRNWINILKSSVFIN